MTDDLRARAIALHDRFTHDGMDRRLFLERMTRLTGSAAAASVMIAGISASPAAAALTRADDPRLVTRKGSLDRDSGLNGYVALPKGRQRRATVMVIHENRGLNGHIEDVARRLALAGFAVVAPDLLTPLGGTPANEDKARDLIGKLDLAASIASAIRLGDGLKRLKHSNGKLGIVGFCWGGAFVNRYAVAAAKRLDAGVAYYGPAPAPADAARVAAPLLLHYAGLDTRVAETAGPWVAALKAAHKDVTDFTYPGVNHAFNNDTSAERYDKAAAELAWGRTIAFLRQHLHA